MSTILFNSLVLIIYIYRSQREKPYTWLLFTFIRSYLFIYTLSFFFFFPFCYFVYFFSTFPLHFLYIYVSAHAHAHAHIRKHYRSTQLGFKIHTLMLGRSRIITTLSRFGWTSRNCLYANYYVMLTERWRSSFTNRDMAPKLATRVPRQQHTHSGAGVSRYMCRMTSYINRASCQTTRHPEERKGF